MISVAPEGQRGFTLIEILVALAILGIALGGLMVGLSNGLAGIQDSTQRTELLEVANSLLATEDALPAPQYGETTGTMADGFQWRLRVMPWGSDEDRRTRLIGAYLVEVQVACEHQSISLTTLRAGAIGDAQ